MWFGAVFGKGGGAGLDWTDWAIVVPWSVGACWAVRDRQPAHNRVRTTPTHTDFHPPTHPSPPNQPRCASSSTSATRRPRGPGARTTRATAPRAPPRRGPRSARSSSESVRCWAGMFDALRLAWLRFDCSRSAHARDVHMAGRWPTRCMRTRPTLRTWGPYPGPSPSSRISTPRSMYV